MIRFGIIGMGNIGQHHKKIFQDKKVTRCEMTAVCDTNPEKLERLKESGLTLFADSSQLIHSGMVDAVIIGTPHYSHTTIGIEALNSGLHVLVEKPISVHKADCERLLAAHKDKTRIFAAMFNLRTDPHYIQIKKMIRNGELGPIQRMNWIITEWFRTEAYYASGGWRATWKGEGGGVLLNQCPHILDLIQWFFGMPQKIRAFCALGKFHNIEVEDDVAAYMEYKNGATGVFIGSTGEAPGTNRLEIAGDRGKLVCENDIITFIRNEIPTREFCQTSNEAFGRPGVWNIEIPVQGKGGQHAEIIQNFVDAILDGVPLIAPAEEGIHSVELANAMLQSSLTQSTVDLPLDGKTFEAMLHKLIAESKFKKKTADAKEQDMKKSFL